MRLTDEQRDIAEHPRGVFVVACPGSGKTRTIVARARNLAQTNPRKGIALLSFTNAAVEEFEARCAEHNITGLGMHPGYVGTFDAFLRIFLITPFGLADVDVKPTVVDSWRSLGISVRLRGADAFPGEAPSLDLFAPDTNAIAAESIGNRALRRHVELNRAAYETAARYRRARLRGAGYVSAADVRWEVANRLESAAWASSAGRALAARFHELIVDEAQDCNPQDISFIMWLRASGIRVTVVADPDQAIYGFRFGTPVQLAELAATYDERDRRSLTGNFRSSSLICGLAATMRLREEPDEAVGDAAEIGIPIHVASFGGARIPSTIGTHFVNVLRAENIEPQKSIVLSHGRAASMRACGYASAGDGGVSNVARVARAVRNFVMPESANSRYQGVRVVEQIIMELMGKINPGELPSTAAERAGVDRRWLRRTACGILGQLAHDCGDSEPARRAWVDNLRHVFTQSKIEYDEAVTINRYFQQRADADWHRLLGPFGDFEIRASTVHEAKGKEFHAVCVVLPPDTADRQRTGPLLEKWRKRAESEAKRVLYVGVTRAQKLVMLAIPSMFAAHVGDILREAQVRCVEHRL